MSFYLIHRDGHPVREVFDVDFLPRVGERIEVYGSSFVVVDVRHAAIPHPTEAGALTTAPTIVKVK